jgi:ABC-2 type transport system permease protein
MSTPSNGVHEFPVEARVAPVVEAETRPLYWSIRRELWENRSIYLAPLIVTAVVLFASLVSMASLPRRMRNLPTDPVKRHTAIVSHYTMPPAPIMLITFVVGFFYALDSLYSERRDRSILFWKSLPVSDRTTVLAKAAIPFAVLPLIAFVLSVFIQIVLLLAGTLVLAGSGIDPAILWAEFHYPAEPVVMIYGLTAHVLWFAPIYGWLTLISAWVKRTPFLWAVIPPITLWLIEKIGTARPFAAFLRERFLGAMSRAFTKGQPGSGGVIDQFDQLTPLRFLSTPGLWLGLIFAAACFAAAMRLRRTREPI